MHARSPLACFCTVFITLLAIALGGSVDLPAQAILAALAGVLLLVAPPRAELPRTPFLIAGALLLLALAAFLPAFGIFPTPWRVYLAHECHIPLASLGSWALRTPQPWLTLQGCGLLFLGATWGLYLLAEPWEREDRVRGAQILVFGVSLLALLAIVAYVVPFHVPGWNQEQNRGWFPNRNQTADVLALVGIVNYALIFDRMRKRKPSGVFLLLALFPILVELVISYSRAGVLLFFGGVLLWHLWPRPGHMERTRGASPKWLALSAAFGIVLVAIFLTWGGGTLDRFHSSTDVGAASGDFSDYRGAIQLDALRLSAQSPLLGVGLGNFEPLFSFTRVDSINGNRAIHPESDWLWVACEMGWPAVVLIVCGYVWWFRRALPLERGSGESMRRGLIVASVAFAIHGFVDVSAHRAGSLWVALLIAGWALPMRPVHEDDDEPEPSRPTPAFFRLLGVLLLVLAAWWGGSIAGYPTPPTTATLGRLKANLTAGKLSPDATERTSRTALGIAPLDWSLYVDRGGAEIENPHETDNAAADFATARALNPYWIALFISEGQTWSAANEPDLALDAWRDGLKRSGPLAHEAFRQMIGLVGLHSVERQGLAELALNNDDYLLMLLPSSTLEEAHALIDHLLQTDPNLHGLSDDQRTLFFDAWWKQGDQVQMMTLLHDHADWEKDAWYYEAQFAAKENNFQHACEIAALHVPAPIIPQASTTQPIKDLAADFASHPDNLSEGLILVLAQMKAGDNEPALETLRSLAKMPDHPRYLAYIAAQLFGTRGEWEKAWAAWQIYLQP
jgi:O-antigen ligase